MSRASMMILALLVVHVLLGVLCLVVARGEKRPLALRLWGAGLLAYAAAPEDGSAWEELFSVADARLYEAKRAGRDRVISSIGAFTMPAMQSLSPEFV